MLPTHLRDRLEGVLGFVITPLLKNDELDLDGLELLVDRIAASGVNGICCAGGVGEFYALNPDEYFELVKTSVRTAAGRVPVIAGVGHATRLAVQLAKAAVRAGASGLMINPGYFVDPSIDGLLAHYQAIADATGLGMIAFSSGSFVYNRDIMERLAEIPEVIGLKDEIGNLGTFSACRASLGGRFAWINGMAEMFAVPYFAAGSRCFTSGLVNFAPEVPLAIHRYGAARDYEAIDRIVNEKVRKFAELRARKKGYSTAVIKAATEMAGLPAGPCRLPLLPLAPEDSRELQGLLMKIGVLNVAPV